MDKEILKGSIDILLLSLIEQNDTYGFQIIKTLKDKSNDIYNMSEGTLYPALQRLETKKLIKSYWGDSETGGRRKYYTITDAGKKKLTEKLNEWNQINSLIMKCKEVLACKSLEPISIQS